MKYAQNLTSLLVFIILCFNGKATPLSGTYYICAGGCNYSTFNDAKADLIKNGVNGAVVFKSSGTFNESVVFPAITGASSANPITFDGGGVGKTRLYNSLSGSSAVLTLDTATHFIFTKMSIEYVTSSPVTGKNTVHLFHSDKNRFIECRIIAPSVSSTNLKISAFSQEYCIGNIIQDNTIRGGFYGVYNYTGSPSNTTYGVHTFKNNKIVSSYYYLVYNYGSYSDTWTGNTIDSVSNSNGAGVYDYYSSGTSFSNNIVISTGAASGCAFWYVQNATSTLPFTVENNLFGPFGSNANYGVVLYHYTSISNVVFRHNTIAGNSSSGYLFYGYMTSTGALDFSNNLIYNKSTGTLGYFNGFNQFKNLDGNDWMGGTTSKPYFKIYCGTNYTNLSSWKSAASSSNSLFAVNDMREEPTFKGGTDLHVDQSSVNPFSPYCGLSLDCDGDSRCKLYPSTGADESNFGKVGYKAKFSGPDTVFKNSPVTYYNVAKPGEPKLHHWYVNGNWVSDSIDLVYSFQSGSTASIKLVTEGCAGDDSITKVIVIVSPTVVPTVDFTSSTNTIIQGDNVSFTDLSTNGPTKWNWEITPKTCYDPVLGNIPAYKILKNDSSQNINVTFYCAGKFDVCLTASNGVGAGKKLCKSGYIEVIAVVNMCSVNLTTASTGYLFDNGGANGDVKRIGTKAPESCGLLIDACADTVYLVLDEFETWCTLTHLRIFDGNSAKGTAINGTMGSSQCTSNTSAYGGPGFNGGTGTCYGGTSKQCIPIIGDTFIATSGKMYIELEEYYANYYPSKGFKAHWYIKPKTNQSKPTASFSSTDTSCVNFFVEFTNQSKGNELKYFWDFDGNMSNGFEDTAANPRYPYTTNGSVNVTLVVQNCGGTDTFSKTIFIKNPNKPKAAFTTNNAKPAMQEIVDLFNTTKECVDSFRWTISNTKGDSAIFVSGSSAFSENPSVYFNDSGCFTVKLWVMNVSGVDSLTHTCFFRVKKAYCVPGVASSLADIGISRVVLNTIDKTSTQGIDGYQNWTSDPKGYTNLEVGGTYNLTVYRKTPMYNNMSRAAWLDWNMDADFNYSEILDSEINKLTSSWSTTISIPKNAKLGTTRLRIGTNYGNLGNAVCGGNKNGEYEDYRIYITSDKTPPVIALTQPDTVHMQIGTAYKEPGFSAYDMVDGNVSSKVIVTSIPTFNKMKTGTYTFYYNVKDSAGNKAIQQMRTVIVDPDTTAPIIVLKGKLADIVSVHYAYNDPGVDSAYDNFDGNITASVKRTGFVDTAKTGTYHFYYQVYDSNGNVGNAIREIEVVDTIAPMITLKGADTVYHAIGTVYKDAGYLVSDNYNKVSELSITTQSNVNEYVVGTYRLSYIAMDKSFNTMETKERIIKVGDFDAPVIKVSGVLNDSMEVNTIYKDTTYTATDNIDKTVNVKVSGTYFNNFAPSYKATKLGTFTLIYSATDKAGNTSTVIKTIKVMDTKAPTISLVGNGIITLCRWDKFTDYGYTVSDNFDDSTQITVTTSNTISTTIDGIFSFKYIATDRAGNKSYSDARIVVVKSIQDCGGNYLGLGELQIANYELRVYPNPNNGTFNIQLPKEEVKRIFITNLLGQVVTSLPIRNFVNPQSEILPVDLTNQPSGIYFINVETEKGIIVRKVTVER